MRAVGDTITAGGVTYTVLAVNDGVSYDDDGVSYSVPAGWPKPSGDRS